MNAEYLAITHVRASADCCVLLLVLGRGTAKEVPLPTRHPEPRVGLQEGKGEGPPIA